MSDLFHVVEDATVILRNRKGVYRQAKVYHRAGRIYAGFGSTGFVRLMARGTSNPDVSWEDLSEDERITINRVHGPVCSNVRRLSA